MTINDRASRITVDIRDPTDKTDPLPAAELHNLLQEFSPSPIGSDLCQAYPALKELIPRREDGLKWEEGAKRGVAVRWVLGVSRCIQKRTAVSPYYLFHRR